MLLRPVVFLMALMVAMVAASPAKKVSSTPLEVVNIVELEESCVAQGGICKLADDCPDSRRAHVNGLCPLQSHLGVECCYEY